MMHALFDKTTIPMLSETVYFAQSRHNLLAGNIANLDTPGYQAQDLPVADFQSRLAEAIQSLRNNREVSLSRDASLANQNVLEHVRDAAPTLLRHDGVDVGMEQQVLEISKNQYLHNLAITVMGSQFRLLQSIISEHL